MSQKAFVIAGLNWISFATGYVFGQIPGMIRSLQKREEQLDLSDGQISLIASTLTMMTLVGFALAAVTSDKMGRRWPFIIFSSTTVISLIMLYHAREMYEFMLSRILTGLSVGALLTLNIFVTAEYTSPKTRAFYLNMATTAAPAIGTSLAHGVGIFLHWRTVALIGIIPNAFGIVLPLFWMESPHWLASKGKFDKCKTAFRRLHGNKLKSDRELQLIIKMEESKLKRADETNSKPTLKRLFRAFKRKYFWDLLILSIVMHAYFAAAGKLVFSILATVIVEEITGSSDILFFTLVIDGFIILGSCMSCFLIGRTSMRTLLFSTGFTANATLVVLSTFCYFNTGQSYFGWIIVAILAFYYVIINAGPYPILEALYSEMFPLELKVYIFSISGVVLILALTLTIVLLPYTVSSIGYHGLFLMNAVIMTLSLGYVWLRLPETKGKTLQEIEVYFKTKNFDIDEILNNEQTTDTLI